MFLRRLAAAALLASILLGSSLLAAQESVIESERQVPVACTVDVVVVGGGTGAVAAAEAAATAGASVFLVAPRPYLGEDMCATLRLRLDGDRPGTPLAERIFAAGNPPTPLQVKKVLEETLMRAGVRFFYGCYPTDLLRDKDGAPSGIVMANRAGRQAVVAKIIVDASMCAAVARMAGAEFRPWPGGKVAFTRTVISGTPAAGKGKKPDDTTAAERTVDLALKDDGFASLAAADQAARDLTWQDGQLRASESLFFVPPNPVRSGPGVPRGCVPAGVARLYVLSGYSDIPRGDPETFLGPSAMTELGRQVGEAAAKESKRLPAPAGPHVPGGAAAAAEAGEVMELLQGPRPTDKGLPAVVSNAHPVPVLGRYDVVVIGGGTAGAPAAIGAARRGAKTLVVEYQEGLGGVGTLGLIGQYYSGLKIGFTKEVPVPGKTGGPEAKMEWYRREVRKAGGDVWFGALGCGALVENGSVKGAVVATPLGRGVVLAKAVIDATGNADVAIAAGAGYGYGADADDIALQGVGLPARPLGAAVVNTDYLLTDETDMVDVWATIAGVTEALGSSTYDMGTLIDSRERRRVIGDHVLMYEDQLAGRTYPDSIVMCSSDYDAHGYPVRPYFALMPHDEKSRKENHPAPHAQCFVPYRCLLPRGMDGILVTGLGISAHRDAIAMVRMQADVQNQGYAAGVAAAMAAAGGSGTRGIDVRALQRHLVEIGNLPPEVLTQKDSFPLPDAEIAEAVRAVVNADRPLACRALAVVLSHIDKALPLVRQAYAAAKDADRLTYAKILGFQGDAAAVPALLAALDAAAWDEAILQGRMAEYSHLPTPVDGLVMALGATRDSRAVPAILRKLDQLDADAPLSHHRAVALALESIAAPAAAPALAALLRKPRMAGYAMVEVRRLPSQRSASDAQSRTPALREIVLARALYRCGDQDGMAEAILKGYEKDLRGLFARHAAAVLAAGKSKRGTVGQ
jgi:hypothetical protein